MPRADGREVAAVEGDDGGCAEALGEGDHGRVDAAERVRIEPNRVRYRVIGAGGWNRHRPLAAAATVGPAAEEGGPGTFRDAGPYSLLTADTSAPDTAAMRRALADVTGRKFAGPEISPADRSALRMDAASHHTLAAAVLWTALRYSAAMLDAGNRAEATRALDWADAFVRDAGLGQEQREMVQHGRDRLARASGDGASGGGR